MATDKTYNDLGTSYNDISTPYEISTDGNYNSVLISYNDIQLYNLDTTVGGNVGGNTNPGGITLTPSSSLSNIRAKVTIVQPQFIRSRHAFRSPMNSEKINLEMSQVRFDLLKLYNKASDVEDKTILKNSILFNESIVLDPSELQLSWTNQSTHMGIQQIALKLEKLNQRIAVLERGLE